MKHRWIALIALLVAGVCAGILILEAGQPAMAAPVPPLSSGAPLNAPAAGTYVLVAWNDLGMHCYNMDFSNLAVLPPYNTLWAQVILAGNPPKVITTGVTVSYSFPGNTYSAGKTNFWTYAQKLFGLAAPLPADVGLTGKGLTGVMDAHADHFEAAGIPITEYSDISPTVRSPYQLATIIVRDAGTNAVLTQNQVVAPVSSEMLCDTCHSNTGIATTKYPIAPTGNIDTNILTLHDYMNQSRYPAGHTGALMDPARRPILCAECHSSNALGAAGVAGLPSLSNGMHRRHQNVAGITPDTTGCYACHPGPTTRCLRDTMSQDGMTCLDCHGGMTVVAQNPNPWLVEPRCDTCHESRYRQTQALYRFSKGHGGLYCEACHDSTHAIATSREPNDKIKFMNLQGMDGTLRTCTVCHAATPANPWLHMFVADRDYLPMIRKTSPR